MNGFQSLGIDLYSLAIYLINFGIIVFIVSKYLTGPITSILDKRAALIKGNLSEADKLKEEMLLQKSIFEAEHVKARTQLNDEINSLKSEIERKRKVAEQEIETKRNEMLDDLNKSISNQKALIKEELKEDITKTVQKMVLHIVSNKIPEKVLEESVEEAWDMYKK